MIDSNLSYLNSFLNEPDIQLIFRTSSKLCPAEEMGLEYSRCVNKDGSENFDLDFRINPRIFRDTSPDEKVFIFLVLRMFHLLEDSIWNYLYEDFSNLLDKRGFRNERYFYLKSLSDSQFAYEIDCLLTPNTRERRNFFRRIKSNYSRKELSLRKLFLEYFKIELVELRKKNPKRLVRHKGYRDHGSLGTGDRKLDRDIYSDVWVQQEEERREKDRKTTLELLRSLTGWI